MPSTSATESASELTLWRGPNALRALRHRDFALFWSGLAISSVGTWMQLMALPWLVYDMTHNKLYLGFVGAAGTLPMLLFTLPSGVLADRFSKRKITIVTQSLAMMQALILASLVYTRAIQPWHVLILAGFLGTVNALDVPARQAMTMELVGRQDVLNAVALNSSAFNSARAVGPAIGGLIYHSWGPATCFLINGVSYLAVIVGLVLIRKGPTTTDYDGESMLSHIRQGLSYARRDLLIKDLLVLTGAFSVFGLQYGTIMPAFVRDVFRGGADRLGILMSSAGLGALAGAISVAVLGHLFARGKIMLSGTLLAPIGLMAFSRCSVFPVACGCLVLAGFGVMLFLAVSNSLIQTASPDSLRGRMLALRTLVFMGLAPLGSLLIASVAQAAGVRVAILAGGAACLVAAMVCGLSSRAVRRAQ